MSELGESYGGMWELSQKKRAKNRQTSTDLLREKGYEIDVKNNGAHVIVGCFDFWPGTGLFICRDNKKIRGRGVFNLIKKLQGLYKPRRMTVSETLRESISDLGCVQDVSKTLKKFDKL